ncbi:hypothetical protein GLYMA_11G207201v4 [Glycine max]|nr:hypothetical protein GLYMA_11G207201v4 [Glycine max]KAH1160113.1 hypothetical protein GYH30_031742 [Glycine max]
MKLQLEIILFFYRDGSLNSLSTQKTTSSLQGRAMQVTMLHNLHNLLFKQRPTSILRG